MRAGVIGALLLVPLLDSIVLVSVAGQTAWTPTVALIVVTALLGLVLVRAEGRRTMARFRQSVAAGDLPADQLIDGALLLVAGTLLVTPGLVTDALGLLATIPITRRPLRSLLKTRVIVPRLEAETGGFMSGRVYTTGFPVDQRGPEETIDIETPDEDEERNP